MWETKHLRFPGSRERVIIHRLQNFKIKKYRRSLLIRLFLLYNIFVVQDYFLS